ncbi:MAG: hypothetical protein KAJ18_11740 [Candidatus Omnitrophica bacterium]|nr:hypothetical protein [Candidatus Omnitrophota bacterium]
MKKIIVLILFLFMASASYAEEGTVDDATREFCNNIMVNFYHDIVAEKDKYKELEGFGEDVFYENEKGFFTIIYQYVDESLPERLQVPYTFGITIEGIKDSTFQLRRGSFGYEFPVLGIKLSGYKNERLRKAQFNATPLINKYSKLLADHQQNYLPLRLSLAALKDSYEVRENIVFEVTLTNVSQHNMLVDDLTGDMLEFLIGNKTWNIRLANWDETPRQKAQRLKRAERKAARKIRKAANEARKIARDQKLKNNALGNKIRTKKTRKAGKFILEAGESLSIVFQGENFLRPREIEVYGIYRMLIKGVRPIGKFNLKIVPEPE